MKIKTSHIMNPHLGKFVCLGILIAFLAANQTAFSTSPVSDESPPAATAAEGTTFTDDNWVSMGGLPGANKYVRAMVTDDSGDLFVGGDFTVIGTTKAKSVAKWDGNQWSSLGSGFGGENYLAEVHTLAVSDAGLYAGGRFVKTGEIEANNIAMWDGIEWASLGSGMNGWVESLVVSGADLYAGGSFTTAGGIEVNHIAKWDGSVWSPLGSGMDGQVLALAVFNGELYAGGNFWRAGGLEASKIAKWDGSEWSPVGSWLDGSVNAFAVLGDDLYTGGDPLLISGVGEHYIAKWDGSQWSPLDSGIQGEGNTSVSSLAISGGNLYVGGSFKKANNISANYISKWNGREWSPLGTGISGEYLDITMVTALAVSDATLYIGGDFNTVDGSAASHVAKWEDGEWSPLGSGLGDEVNRSAVSALAISGDDLYAGGVFTRAGGIEADYIAKWDGNEWSSLGSGINDEEFAGVWALAASGTDLYVGGRFAQAGGIGVNSIAKWDGNEWSPLGSGISGEGGSSVVSAIVASGPNVYAGGKFTMAGGIKANSIAKWNGSDWAPIGSGIGGEGFVAVSALAVLDGDLYAGGTFMEAGAIAANSIARWDGSRWWPLGSGLSEKNSWPSNGHVYALAASDADLYVGGLFTAAGGIGASSIAKWDGNQWSPLGSGVSNNGFDWLSMGSGGGPHAPQVHALAVSENVLYVGGRFYVAGDKVSAYLAKVLLKGSSPLE